MQEPATPGGEQQWIPPIEMARKLAIGKTKVYEILSSNSEIQTIRLGRAIRINKASLVRWIERRGRPQGAGSGSNVEGDRVVKTPPNSGGAKRPLEILLNPKDPDYQDKVEAFVAAFGERYATVEQTSPEMAVLKIYPGGATELPK